MSDEQKTPEQVNKGQQAGHRALIEALLNDVGLKADEWRTDDDGLLEAVLGRWGVTEDDEDKGLFVDEQGELTASVVGAPEYGNEQAKFYILPDDQEVPIECAPFENIEAANQ